MGGETVSAFVAKRPKCGGQRRVAYLPALKVPEENECQLKENLLGIESCLASPLGSPAPLRHVLHSMDWTPPRAQNLGGWLYHSSKKMVTHQPIP